MNENEAMELIIKSISENEGLTVEEAKLSYQARKDLPETAFCGPDKSYPAHDAAHVRDAFSRLSAFGGKLKPATRSRIHACLVRRAKHFGIEHQGCRWCSKKVEETIEWFLADYNKCKDCE